jgi:hypothetical protein
VARLIHPVEVVVRNIDTDASDFDKDFEESGDIRYEAEFSVKGQVRFYQHKKTTAGSAGYEQIGDGYVLLHTADAEEVEINAEIVRIAGNACNYLTIEKRPCVHKGSSLMMRVYFEAPGKSTETK